MKNYNLIIDSLIKIGVASALIIAATTSQPYSYYTFLRWLVMVTFIYFSYIYYSRGQYGLIIYFGAIAVLFNPFSKFWFQKEMWQLIDFLVAGITLFTIITDWIKTIKPAPNKD
jgi:hypothetical protein|tara:strand:- start:1161 stop:1502 length:342 start_codon:yes stop_codon:yes gene_type:complete